jgi:predicted DNA repair protein MutK
MAGASLFALLDDIATLLDDVSILTNVAAKKTAGVLGDHLAHKSQQVTAVTANPQLPVVWAVAKGSLLNKAILVPAALAISAWLPWAITPLMMLGGAFLCYEGVEKLAHKFLHSKDEDDAHKAELTRALADDRTDVVAWEKNKIKGAVRTDFILSAEIIVLSLGVVSSAPFGQQVATLIAVALGMTVFVYGLVAGIVKLDDIGAWMLDKGKAMGALGRGILHATPWLMRGLSIAGTAAMFLVGGGILVHSIPALHHFVVGLAPSHLEWLANALGSVVVGVGIGAVVLAVVTLVQKLRGGSTPAR